MKLIPEYQERLRLGSEVHPQRGLRTLPRVSAVLAEADATYHRIAGRPLSPAFLDPRAPAISDEDSHCAVLVVNVAIQRLLEDLARFSAIVVVRVKCRDGGSRHPGCDHLRDALRPSVGNSSRSMDTLVPAGGIPASTSRSRM